MLHHFPSKSFLCPLNPFIQCYGVVVEATGGGYLCFGPSELAQICQTHAKAHKVTDLSH